MSKHKPRSKPNPLNISLRQFIYTYKYSVVSTVESVKRKPQRIVFYHEFTVFLQPTECHAPLVEGSKHVFYTKDGWVLYGAQSSPSIDLRGKKIYLQGPGTAKDMFTTFSEELVLSPDELVDFVESAQDAQKSLQQFDMYLKASEDNPIPNEPPEDLSHERFNSLEF